MKSQSKDVKGLGLTPGVFHPETPCSETLHGTCAQHREFYKPSLRVDDHVLRAQCSVLLEKSALNSVETMVHDVILNQVRGRESEDRLR